MPTNTIGGIAQWSSDQRRKEEMEFETAKDLLRLTSLYSLADLPGQSVALYLAWIWPFLIEDSERHTNREIHSIHSFLVSPPIRWVPDPLLSSIYSLLVILVNRIPFTHRKEGGHTHTTIGDKLLAADEGDGLLNLSIGRLSSASTCSKREDSGKFEAPFKTLMTSFLEPILFFFTR